MTLQEGQRVKLAGDLRLTDPSEETEAAIGILSLAAGTPGTVDHVTEQTGETPEAAEYGRLASLLDSYGDTMPPESKKQLEQKIAALEPAWTAFREQGPRVRVRVRFDNGLVLDSSPQHLFVPA
ncbi:hypothetical protein G3I40_36485 [Streptomyces sp. SID14478]|uniref:hypothetical protein n=1 Tax=Streptomyces sp. SID14478 TaxID=2706073 RepID=UPI0013DEFE9F|nr:hypothetical protein [Streptomyces sp. SID14478]NEB80668.1 hypothetical protein [Streptomyces sp. SID14478]